MNPPIKSHPVARLFSKIGMGLVLLIGALALHYSTLQPNWLRTLLACGPVAIVGYVLFERSFRITLAVWSIAVLALGVWYVSDQPSNNRDWEPEYKIPATFLVSGRTASVQHIRNFSYRSETDFTPAYYDADFVLDRLISVDLVSSYWAGDAIAHVFLSFGFNDGRHVAFSIETRRAKGVGYSTVAGFFHHYELFYVVGDERDLIGVRTDVRRERVYLYRLRLTPQVREGLFLSYLNKVQQLSSHPEWYNTVSDNCTTGILNRAGTVGDIAYNWRVMLSGYAAEYAYSLGLLDTDESFAELQRKSLIKRPLGGGPDIGENFSQSIRRELPINP